MENEKIVDNTTCSATAEQECPQEIKAQETTLPKFKSVEELEKSYQHLHAELTRKSQLLKELQAQASDATIQSPCGNSPKSPPLPDPFGSNTHNSTESLAAKHMEQSTQSDSASVACNNQVAGYDKLVKETDNARQREAIIKEYLMQVATKRQAPVVITDTTNDFAFMQQTGLKSLHELTSVTAKFFETKRTK